MSSGDGPKVSCEEIQMVQNRIEYCLRQYMSRKEVVNTLFIQDNIEPTFTELVWQKLEEENQEFFQAYYLKLMVKEQIIEFNRLLSEQVKMTQQVPSAIASLPISNGCNIMPIYVQFVHILSSIQLLNYMTLPQSVAYTRTALKPNRLADSSIWQHYAPMFLSGNHSGISSPFSDECSGDTTPLYGDCSSSAMPFWVTVSRTLSLVLTISSFCIFLAIVLSNIFSAELTETRAVQPDFLVKRFSCTLHQSSTCGAAENVGTAAKPNGMHEPVHADRPNAFSNSSSSVLSCMQTTIDIPSQSRKIDGPPNMFLGQPSNMGMRQTMDGRIIKTEPIYGGNSPFAFGPHGTYLESRSAMGDASVSSFSSVESNTQPLNEPLLDADTSSFGFLGDIPQNFGFSDLTADFTNSSDILGSYSRTPFLATDTGNLLDSNGGIERLTNPSENLRYTNFSGD
ncbi:hypothetical protein MTR67_000150 [Solanum verrucosum]|uniref:Uncharacterized protein n=1 Tax=Solanum verrucosum TaxID=315347 RepID=A0AAF0PPJ6_SOLVR|nr:hypothetical protein MTR67_000150 [Solanum verrucosum]